MLGALAVAGSGCGGGTNDSPFGGGGAPGVDASLDVAADASSDSPNDVSADAPKPCASTDDCPTPTELCKLALCASSSCTTAPAPEGTDVPASSQKAGDCKKLVCGAAGAVSSVADATDLPADDGNACTDEVCTGPNPGHPDTAVGTACGFNGGGDAGVADASADGGAAAGFCTGAGACGVCNPGTSDCDGTTPRTCSASGAWSTGTVCPFVCTGAGQCTGVCVPVATDCLGAQPRLCDSTGHWASNGSACPYVCSSGACAGACVPGGVQCSGAVPQSCETNGAWKDAAACTYACNAGTCGGVCVPGDGRCNGQNVQSCDASGQWVSTSACPFVCTNAACAGVCVAGATRCIGATVQVCDAAGSWHDDATCPYACGSGACTGVCVPGDKRCTGNAPESCTGVGQWLAGAPCTSLESCTAGACVQSCFPPVAGGACDTAPQCGCPGQACDLSNVTTGATACYPTGATLPWTACAARDCGAGYSCVGGVCKPFCQSNADCAGSSYEQCQHVLDGATATPIPGASVCSRQCNPLTAADSSSGWRACGTGAKCLPGESGSSDCLGPIGTGTMGAACAAQDSCGAGYICVDTTGLGAATCEHLCALGATACSAFGRACLGFAPALFAGAAEYGACLGSCSPGARRCNGTTAQVCGAGGEWLDDTVCSYTCTNGGCSGVCVPGSTQCSGSSVQTCSAQGAWSTSNTCPYVCATGACSGTCVPGATRCNGATPQTCDGTGAWAGGNACPFVCSGGQCGGVCVPGSTQCLANAVQTCSAAGAWQTTSTCSYVCSSGACAGSCAPGAKQCSGTTAQVCNSGGSWQDDTVCSYVCVNGACSGVCAPGTTQCNGLAAQTCNAAGQWQTSQTCPYVCTAGACTGTCAPGGTRCSGATPQTCNSTGAWVSGTGCPFVCSSGSCAGVCVPGTTQCSGSAVQLCSSAGQWQTSQTCPNICSAGACAGVCVPGAVQCKAGSTTTPQTCDAGGQWQDSTVCSGTAPLCLAGACTAGCHALKFNGSTDIVTVPASTDFTYGAAFTAEAWFYAQTGNAYQHILAHNKSTGSCYTMWLLDLENGSNVRFQLNDNVSLMLQKSVAVGAWHHVAGVYMAGSMSMYVDGVLVGSKAATPAGNTAVESLGFGRCPSDPTAYAFAGMIGPSRISGSGRYSSTFVPSWGWPSDASTIALWNMTEGSGTSLSDASGNVHTATIASPAWTTWTSVACPAAATPQWKLMGSKSAQVMLGSCSGSTSSIATCNAANIGVEARVYSNSSTELKPTTVDTGALQGASASLSGADLTLTGRVGCGGDNLQTVSVQYYVCGY